MTRLPELVLEQPQRELLGILVESSRRVSPDARRDFLAVAAMGAFPGILLSHPGLPDGATAHPQDLQVLVRAGLVTMTQIEANAWTLFVNPEGFHYHDLQLARAQTGSDASPISDRVIGEIAAAFDALFSHNQIDNMFQQIDGYRRIRGVVEKIRYGQCL